MIVQSVLQLSFAGDLMLDLGFIWFFVKSMRDPFLIATWLFCLISFTNAPAGPLKDVFFAVGLAGLLYLIVTLGRSLVKDKYKEYRAQQEAAWNILKDNK
jgi:hypothetical protein